ncbi:MAG: hypothetical protein JXA25_04165 [Anaerolineales bacterium]|nr:hypothetical protein [Anaerolineales bacterium]
MRNWILILGLMLLVIGAAACTAGSNEMEMAPDEDGRVAGFGLGIWQGLISPITFVISLFSDNVHVYEVHNTGSWYDFGFLLGAMMTFGGGGRGSAHRRG